MSGEQHHDDSHEAVTEISHPLIWTAGLVGFGFFLGWWFSTLMGEGRMHGLQNPVTASAAPAGPQGPDHMELIKALDDESLALGERVYQNNCTSCHGPDGQLAVGGARKFGTEPLQNDIYGPGASPLSLYHTLTEGWNGGAMPPQAISPEEKYAVIHYLREEYLQGTEQYQPLEEEYLATLAGLAPAQQTEAAVLPVPGVDFPHPAEQPLGIPVYAVLAERSAATPSATPLLRRFAYLEVAPGLREARDQLAALRDTLPGRRLVEALARDDRAAFADILFDAMVLEQAPALAVLGDDDVKTIYGALRWLRSVSQREEVQ